MAHFGGYCSSSFQSTLHAVIEMHFRKVLYNLTHAELYCIVINDKGPCTPAPATPSLLIRYM